MSDPSLMRPPSPWVVRFAPLVDPGGRILDIACGRGRHTRFFASRGHPVTAVDRNAEALEALKKLHGVDAVPVDLEADDAWPLAGQRFAAVVVTNFLCRPLFPVILDAVAEGGILIHETFADGNERFGRPSNPDYLLRAGELIEIVRGKMRVVAFEEGIIEEPRPAVVQRICAIRSSDASPLPAA